jgi:hypothetical protein
MGYNLGVVFVIGGYPHDRFESPGYRPGLPNDEDALHEALRMVMEHDDIMMARELSKQNLAKYRRLTAERAAKAEARKRKKDGRPS